MRNPWLVIAFASSIILDQATKAFAPGIINYGMVWGFFANHPIPLWVFLLFATVVTMALVCTTHQASYLSKLGATLSIAGIMSNILDRILQGGVVDIITLRTEWFTWPTFNVADMSIVLGGACIAWSMGRRKKQPV